MERDMKIDGLAGLVGGFPRRLTRSVRKGTVDRLTLGPPKVPMITDEPGLLTMKNVQVALVWEPAPTHPYQTPLMLGTVAAEAVPGTVNDGTLKTTKLVAANSRCRVFISRPPDGLVGLWHT